MTDPAQELAVLLRKFHHGNPNTERWLEWLEASGTQGPGEGDLRGEVERLCDDAERASGNEVAWVPTGRLRTAITAAVEQRTRAEQEIARLSADRSAMTKALAAVLHLAYDDEMPERLSEAITSAIGKWESDARAALADSEADR